MEKTWKEYYERTKDNPPTPLLGEAVSYVQKKEKAIDIGAGALRDTRYLLEQGFDVTALDQEKMPADVAKLINSKKFHPVVSSFEDFEFPKGEYDIASAMWSLPFNPPETFNRVFNGIKQSLGKGGILCGQFFGNNDEWSTNPKMTFHTKEQAEKLLEDMEVVSFDEREIDGKTADGNPKHWHVFNFIAKKL